MKKILFIVFVTVICVHAYKKQYSIGVNDKVVSVEPIIQLSE